MLMQYFQTYGIIQDQFYSEGLIYFDLSETCLDRILWLF